MRLPPGPFTEAFLFAGYSTGEPSREDYENASKPNAPPEPVEKIKRWEDQYEKDVDSFLRELTALFMAGLPCRGRRNVSDSEREDIHKDTWNECFLDRQGNAIQRKLAPTPRSGRLAPIGPYTPDPQGRWGWPVIWVDLWFPIAKFREMWKKREDEESGQALSAEAPDIATTEARVEMPPPIRTGLQGRSPTGKDLVLAEFERRRATNSLERTLPAEAD